MATTWNAADSAQILASETNPSTLSAGYADSELRVAYGKLTIAAASGNATARMVRLPAGKIIIFPKLSWANLPDMASGGTLSIGLGAYTNATGSVVSADVDALLTATDVGNGINRTALLGTVTNSEFSIELESKGGVNVTATAATADTNATGILEVAIAFATQG